MPKSKAHNAPLERSTLGALIKDVLLFFQFKDRLAPELFFDGRHQRIVKIMHGLSDTGRDFSISAIAGRLPDDQDRKTSPEGYLAILIQEAAEPADLHDLITDLEELHAGRQMNDLGQALISNAFEDNGLTARERLDKARDAITTIGDRLTTQASHVHDVSERMIARVQDAYLSERTIGMRTGLKALDDLMGPALPGHVIVLAGSPGAGKSMLGWLISRNFCKTAPGLFFSQEMEPEDLTARDVAQKTGIPAHRIQMASVNSGELEQIIEASATLKDMPLFIDGEPGLNHIQIRNRVYRQRRMHGCGFIVIDHLLYCGKTERRQTGIEAVGENMKGFKLLAKKLKIPVIVLAQLTKEFGAGKWQDVRRPLVADIYGGSAVEQDSDVIVFVHRPDVLLERKKPSDGAKDYAEWEAEKVKWEGKAEISVGKRRGFVGHGTRVCFFDGPMMAFSDMEPAQKRKLNPQVDYAEASRLI